VAVVVEVVVESAVGQHLGVLEEVVQAAHKPLEETELLILVVGVAGQVDLEADRLRVEREALA
jgi:hypothetical protein